MIPCSRSITSFDFPRVVPCDVCLKMAVVVWARGRRLTAYAADVGLLSAVNLNIQQMYFWVLSSAFDSIEY